jgi:hypothetical protein
MGFGVIVASGTGNTPLGPDLSECLIEVRVEQSLDEPARFGIRVREDISEGQPMAARAPELKVEQMITVAVQLEDKVVCLARGPITDTQSQYTLGGPGSWYQVHGSDRRIELSRQCFQHSWEGRASDAARTILSGYGFEPDIQDTSKTYSKNTETLNQRATDLDFLKTIAKENGFFFWLSYGVAPQGRRRAGSSASPKRRIFPRRRFVRLARAGFHPRSRGCSLRPPERPASAPARTMPVAGTTSPPSACRKTWSGRTRSTQAP